MFKIVYLALGAFFIWDAWTVLGNADAWTECPLEVGRVLELLLGVFMIIGILVRVLG